MSFDGCRLCDDVRGGVEGAVEEAVRESGRIVGRAVVERVRDCRSSLDDCFL